MLRQTLMIGCLFTACGGYDSPKLQDPDAAVDGPGDVQDLCPGPGRDKIKFARAHSCSNDGSVEWCIPDNNAQLVAMLTAIAPTISCAPGGGRARCLDSPGQLLCFYPTRFPEQCISRHGAMTADAWADVCSIAALQPITAIVHTVLE